MRRASRPLVVVGGSIAQRPHRGGHAWVFLQYLIGFRRLGWDVLFLDRLTDEMLGDHDESSTGDRYRPNVNWFLSVMCRAGVGDAYSLALPGGISVGLERSEVLRRAGRASFILDINGFLRDEEISAAIPVRVFLDIDPGFNQMWQELGLATVLDGYDAFVTVAQRIGKVGCRIPTCGRSWITTYPPVVLDEWPVAPANPGACFTTVASWRGPFAPVEYGGQRYGLRVHEFRDLAEIPTRCRERFQVALDIDPSDQSDRQTLLKLGWNLVDPVAVAAGTEDYRGFIQKSKAEFAVAKEMYVKTRGGWISDRSVCYLASGKPVVTQDTGLEAELPANRGFWTYSTLDEGILAVQDVAGDYARQATLARALAVDLFDSDRVLSELITRISPTIRR